MKMKGIYVSVCSVFINLILTVFGKSFSSFLSHGSVLYPPKTTSASNASDIWNIYARSNQLSKLQTSSKDGILKEYFGVSSPHLQVKIGRENKYKTVRERLFFKRHNKHHRKKRQAQSGQRRVLLVMRNNQNQDRNEHIQQQVADAVPSIPGEGRSGRVLLLVRNSTSSQSPNSDPTSLEQLSNGKELLSHTDTRPVSHRILRPPNTSSSVSRQSNNVQRTVDQRSSPDVVHRQIHETAVRRQPVPDESFDSQRIRVRHFDRQSSRQTGRTRTLPSSARPSHLPGRHGGTVSQGSRRDRPVPVRNIQDVGFRQPRRWRIQPRPSPSRRPPPPRGRLQHGQPHTRTNRNRHSNRKQPPTRRRRPRLPPRRRDPFFSRFMGGFQLNSNFLFQQLDQGSQSFDNTVNEREQNNRRVQQRPEFQGRREGAFPDRAPFGFRGAGDGGFGGGGMDTGFFRPGGFPPSRGGVFF